MGAIARGPGTTAAWRRPAARWAASLVAVAAVLGAEFGLLHTRIVADVSALVAGGAVATPATAPRAAVPPAPAPPAPAAAGDVRGADLRAFAPCTSGTACTVRLHVDLHPRPEAVRVAWRYRITDLCTGSAVAVPGGAVTVPPGAGRTDLVTPVTLPHGAVLAVVAVLDAPAVAAAPALTVPAQGTCPGAPR